jgi:hypothetical protein
MPSPVHESIVQTFLEGFFFAKASLPVSIRGNSELCTGEKIIRFGGSSVLNYRNPVAVLVVQLSCATAC